MDTADLLVVDLDEFICDPRVLFLLSLVVVVSVSCCVSANNAHDDEEEEEEEGGDKEETRGFDVLLGTSALRSRTKLSLLLEVSALI